MRELLIESICWEKEEGVPIKTTFGEKCERPPRFIELPVPLDLQKSKFEKYALEQLESQYHQKPIEFKLVDPFTSRTITYHR